MFNGAGAMWLSVRKQRCFQLQRGHPMADWGDLTGLRDEHPHLHAAGAQCQGSEKSPCSRPARQQSRGRRMLRFFLTTGRRQQWRMPNPRRAILRPRPSFTEATHRCGPRGKGGRHPRQRKLA